MKDSQPDHQPVPIPPPARDMRPILRVSLGLDICIRLALWSTAAALSLYTFNALNTWPRAPLNSPSLGPAIHWAVCLAWFILLFNVYYVVALLFLRLLIPTPREGRYEKGKGGFSRQLVWATLLAVLNKARYFAPFPGFLVSQVIHLPPLCWLMGPLYGPKSRSCYLVEPAILDPHLVEIGRNVVIGFNATIAGHYQERDAWILKRTIIADEVVIGGNTIIYAGVRVGTGAVIASGAIVPPNTIIGPNEFWGGVPARKIRDLPQPL